MKKLLLIATVGLALVMPALALLPTFKTFSASGTANLPAQANIPADPNSQIRVVNVYWSSDTAGANLTFMTAGTALTQTATNQATSSVTNQINSTNGLTPGILVMLQHNGVLYTNKVLTFNQSTNIASPYQGTNVVLRSGGWGVAANAGDDIFVMNGATNSIPVGATTNVFNGEAVYVGNYGRPVAVILDAVTAASALNSINVHYDSN